MWLVPIVAFGVAAALYWNRSGPPERRTDDAAAAGAATATATAPQPVSSPWRVTIDDRSGLPIVSRGGASAVTTTYAFWGTKWSWASMRPVVRPVSAVHSELSGTVGKLNLELTGEVRKESDRRWTWKLDLDASQPASDVIGGGMVFAFNLDGFNAELGDPVLLPDQRGWRWGRDGGPRLEMRFEPALAALYFERGNQSQARAFFYEGTIPQGKRSYAVTLTLSADMNVASGTDARSAPVDPSRWPLDTLDVSTSPVDLSFLNAAEKPAGKRGFVRAEGDHLVFADGARARFWGTNLTAGALFKGSRESVVAQARRLSALGFNLVRLHHHDSEWVNPNVFGDRSSIRDTQSLNAASLDRLDWWVKCLKDEGIYVWLDLHVGRAFRAGDGITAFDELRGSKATGEAKGFNYVNASVQQAFKRFNEAYVGHVNPYTGLAYKDEPAIAAMLITNENDITHHFGNSMLPDKGVPEHTKLYMDEAERFARAQELPKDKVWRSWEPGPSKLFLNDLERRFGDDLRAHLRGLGVKVPIATTNTWGHNGLSSLPALTAGDLIDAHAYGGSAQLEANPMLAANLVDWLAAAQVVGMPMSVTEWNAEPFPTADRHTLPLYVASSAAHQGWDAVMHYAYSQEPMDGRSSASNWHAYNDPALLSLLPAAGLLYRRGDVREAESSYVYAPGREQLFFGDVSAKNAPALRTGAVKGKLSVALPAVKELPWLKPAAAPKNARVFTDATAPLIDAASPAASSDTGELQRSWDQGTLVVDTPRTQVASGWLGGRRVALSSIEVALTTPNATVAVQSLSESPIATSKSVMISVSARAVPQDGNRVPFRVEPVDGELVVRGPAGLRLFRRDDQQRMVPVPVAFVDGRYRLRLDETLRTQWLFLREGGG